jgi:hypothetical protein
VVLFQQKGQGLDKKGIIKSSRPEYNVAKTGEIAHFPAAPPGNAVKDFYPRKCAFPGGTS